MGTFTTVYSFSSRYRLNNMETNEQSKYFEKEEQENSLISAIITKTLRSKRNNLFYETVLLFLIREFKETLSFRLYLKSILIWDNCSSAAFKKLIDNRSINFFFSEHSNYIFNIIENYAEDIISMRLNTQNIRYDLAKFAFIIICYQIYTEFTMSIESTNIDLEKKQLLPNTCISRFSIPETLELIKEQTGLELELCDYFTGIKEHNGRKYFNVILSQRTSESKAYEVLKRFADKYKLISVEPNGVKRVAIFQNDL